MDWALEKDEDLAVKVSSDSSLLLVTSGPLIFLKITLESHVYSHNTQYHVNIVISLVYAFIELCILIWTSVIQ